ncbi:MAG: c-type cytochrome [Nitrospirae bacterium]|nr:c-type cytochrome [Nitrospirota bacterium]
MIRAQLRLIYKYVLTAPLYALLASILFACLFPVPEVRADDDARRKSGEKIYGVRCLVCHGKAGDGKGPAGILRKEEASGRVLEVRPRDFTLGLFKFRSTSTGCLPTEDDLLHTISNGIPRSFMPPLKELPDGEKKALEAYIKTFSSRFTEESPCKPVAAKMPQWVGSEQSVAKGKKIYKDMKCWECHGETGKGDGPKSNDIKDDWGNQILPFNFTTGDLKRGSSPENIYITFTTGLDGSGMPAYEDSLSEEARWDLVSYTLKIMGRLDKNFIDKSKANAQKDKTEAKK